MATSRELSSKLIRDYDDDEEVWLTHYSSNHQILLVGEGDFSFSCSLASRFRSASNICASSLDSYADDVVRKYSKARSNLATLKRLGASLLHGVDATKLHLHPHLNSRRFDRIIFNFPHAGFHGKETDSRLIQKHKALVFGFFLGAAHMVRADGEIHCVAFEKSEYPGYENKRGDGSRCDKPFPLGECTTFKFAVSRVAKEIYAEKVRWRETKERESKLLMYPLQPQTQSQGVSQRPVQVHDPLVQSRQLRTSPLDLGYYRELIRCSQFEDARYIPTAQRPASFALERHHDHCYQDNLRYNERSSFQFHEFCHHREEERCLECSSRFSGVPLDIYNRERQSMLTRTSYPRRYTGESPERRPLLWQEPFFLRSSHQLYGWEGGRTMSTSTGFHHLHTEEGRLIRQRNLSIYHPYHW
ncbi:BnaA06g00170D [Brassica napus]|uniref:BnaA06g00170D protein n=1 Tax=Brassica napus TaxID=3708 RepID=A0A078IJ94_BRANA|nr:BnaA06g00170D [Brassica napus]